jgi:hypothetical protein
MNELNPRFSELLNTSIKLRHKYANTLRVEIPENLRQPFKIVNAFTEKPCLVGSAALNLVLQKLGKSAIGINDYDFITPYINPKALISAGFTRTHNLQVYNHPPPLALQIFTLPQGTPNLNSSFLKRDFTVCSLGVFENGDVIGLTEQCLADIKENILRTNYEPNRSIKEDPIKILRAIKMELRGWSLEPMLKLAIQTWQPDEHFKKQQQHILAFTKKMLTTSTKVAFVKQLMDYGLMKTMFGLLLHTSTMKENIATFEKHLTISDLSLSTHPQGFFNGRATETNNKQPMNNVVLTNF